MRTFLILALAWGLGISMSCRKSRNRKVDEHVRPDLNAGEIEMHGNDLYGDALPNHAIARLGSLRMIDRELRRMIFVPGGTQLVATTREGYAIWKATDGTLDRTISVTEPSTAMAVSPDGKTLAAGSEDKSTVVLYDFDTGEPTHRLTGLEGHPVDLCFLASGLLIAASEAGDVRTWDLKSGREVAAHKGPWKTPSALACGDRAATFGTKAGAVYFVGNQEKPTLLGRVAGEVTSAAVADGDKSIAVGSSDETVAVWLEPKPGVPMTWNAHERLVHSVHYVQDGSLITSGGDTVFRRWNAKTGKLIEEIPGIDGLDGQHITMAKKTGMMASWSDHSEEKGSEAGRWWLWRENDGSLLLQVDRHEAALRDISFSPDGSRVATSGEDRKTYIWQSKNGKMLAGLDSAQGSVNAIQWNVDNKTLFYAGDDARLRAWNVASDADRSVIEASGGAINTFVLDRNQERLYTGDQIGRVWAWDVRGKKRIQAFDGGGYSAVHDLALSVDDKLLAIAGSDSKVRVVNLEQGAEAASLSPKGVGANHAVAFSPDGQWLVTGGDDYQLHVWSVSTWAKERSFSGHDGTIQSIVFSPDGTRIASGGSDQTVRLWNFPNGAQTVVLSGHGDVVTAIAFSSQGDQLASASRDGTGLVWQVPPPLPKSPPSAN